MTLTNPLNFHFPLILACSGYVLFLLHLLPVNRPLIFVLFTSAITLALSPTSFLVLTTVTLATYWASKVLTGESKKRFLLPALIIIMAPLCYYKCYYPISLPILGLSFVTFQAISYLVDIYRYPQVVEPRLLFLATYLLYFPKLLAGPIERSSSFLKQLGEKKAVSYSSFRQSSMLIFQGLVEKMVVAANLYPILKTVFSTPSNYGSTTLIFTIILARIHFYADFSGYTNIARGCSGLVGIQLSENFRTPLFATNIVDFWRRWHITLSTWIRDYIFMPLALQFKHSSLIYIWVLASFLVIGAWHGLTANYILYGAMQAFLIAIYQFSAKIRGALFAYCGPMATTIAWIINFFFAICPPIVFLWTQSPVEFLAFFNEILNSTSQRSIFSDSNPSKIFAVLAIWLGIEVTYSQNKFDIRNSISRLPSLVRWPLYWIAIILFILLARLDSSSQFVYMNF